MNPFENDEQTYLVLINGEEQYSLWPSSIAVPAGWTVVYGEESRAACEKYVDAHWTDLRPASLRRMMVGDRGEGDAVRTPHPVLGR
ncbi:MbtH family protein [Amycolatopsis rubida]|uniref:MbtH family protein n=1 Tax=Amycolatopsis rubida TaxID=112413 RepID=A0ABX0C586_9PSEU|nr:MULTISPECIES: MbtH family protein [Amycolatopsis]MYW97929.1 MbtH family NRPS accessory protein [Amycolatopsis rubida]NEC62914.1 MbtH family protein [Amycolatopsis rubida]OAP24943.1 MbtH-like protein [Amycolatopsis sp. M39]